MKRYLKQYAAVAVAGLMMFSCIGCSSTASGAASDAVSGSNGSSGSTTASANPVSSSDRSKTANVAVSSNITTLDPHEQALGPAMTLRDMVFDTLITRDSDGNYQPSLAKEWNISDDGTEWTFKLRDDVKFHDGEDFNADDVVCTFQRLIDTPTLAQTVNYWTSLISVSKVDDYTVTLKVKEASIAVYQGLTTTAIIPNDAYTKNGDGLFNDQIMTGTGPWIFDKWVDGQYIHFTKNPNYWGKNNSYFDDVYMRFVTEPSTAISAQLSGTLDAYINDNGIPTSLIGMYTGTENKINLAEKTTSALIYVGFQCGDNSVFKDADVRRAFSMSINRQDIVDGLLGSGKTALGVANDQTNGYDPNLTSDYYTYNTEAAKKLLAGTGYKGEEITITSISGFNNIALAISEMANAAGFNTKAEVVETAALGEKRSTGDYDCFITNALNPNNDLYQFTNWRILSDAHHSNYVNDELNNLIKQSNTEMDANKRNELLKQVNKIIVDECAPMVSIAQLGGYQAINWGITGINLTGDGFYFLRDISYDPSQLKQ